MDENIYVYLKKNKLFQKFHKADLAKVMQIATVKKLVAGEYLFKMGSIPEEFIIITSGALESNQSIIRLRAGDSIGDVQLLARKPSPVDWVAVEDTELVSINILSLVHLAALMPELYSEIPDSILDEIADNLLPESNVYPPNIKNELIVSHKYLALSRFVCNLIIMMSVYVFCLGVVIQLQGKVVDQVFITLGIVIVFLAGGFIFVRSSGYNLDFFGWTLKNWRKSLFEGIWFSIPVMLFVLFAKYLTIQYFPDILATPELFSPSVGNQKMFLTVFLLYNFTVVLQEFLARGVLQGTLSYLIVDAYRVPMSMLAGNILFSIFHMHLSVYFAAATFFVGFFWAWLFWRHKTLIGCIVSHMLIGNWTLFVVGLAFR